MATTTEIVNVNYTADTSDYDEAVESSEKGTTNFAASIGSVISGTVLAGAALLKLNATFKLFNIETGLAIQKFTFFNVTLFGVKKVLPLLAKGLGALIKRLMTLNNLMKASVIGLVLLIIKSLSEALHGTSEGMVILTTVTKTFSNILDGVVQILIGFGKAIAGLLTGNWQLATEGLAQAWDGVANGIGKAVSNANMFAVVTGQIDVYESDRATRNQELVEDLDRINRALDKEEEYSMNKIKLLKERDKAERRLLTHNEKALNLEKTKLLTDKKSIANKKRLDEINAELAANTYKREILDNKLKEETNTIISYNEGMKRQKETIAIQEETAGMTEGIHYDSTQNMFNYDLQAAENLSKMQLRIHKLTLAEQEILDKQQADRDKKRKQLEAWDTAKIAIGGMQLVADLGIELAGNDRKLQGQILMGKAIAQTALNIVEMFPDPLGMAAAATIGATQIASIANAMNVSGEGTVAIQPSFNTPIDRSNIETSTTLTEPTQVVLVVDDFNKVNNRIQVVDDRASLS